MLGFDNQYKFLWLLSDSEPFRKFRITRQTVSDVHTFGQISGSKNVLKSFFLKKDEEENKFNESF